MEKREEWTKEKRRGLKRKRRDKKRTENDRAEKGCKVRTLERRKRKVWNGRII